MFVENCLIVQNTKIHPGEIEGTFLATTFSKQNRRNFESHNISYFNTLLNSLSAIIAFEHIALGQIVKMLATYLVIF